MRPCSGSATHASALAHQCLPRFPSKVVSFLFTFMILKWINGYDALSQKNEGLNLHHAERSESVSGKVRLTKEHFLNSKGAYYYQKLSKKHTHENLIDYFVANMIEMDKESNFWIGNFLGEICFMIN